MVVVARRSMVVEDHLSLKHHFDDDLEEIDYTNYSSYYLKYNFYFRSDSKKPEVVRND